MQSLIDLLVVAFYIPAQLSGVSSTGLVELGLAAFDISGSLIVILVVAKLLAHFFFGVSQPGGQPAKTLKNTSPGKMFPVALGATFTASKSLVMVPFLAVAFLAPISAWIAVPLAFAGVAWGTLVHAWSNYLVEVPYLHPTNPAESVTVYSHPVTAQGDLQTPDPRANFKGFLNQIFLGGHAVPAYEKVNQAIYSVHLKGRDGRYAANSGNLALARIESNPGAWIANRALLLEENKREDGVAFLNTVVFFSNQLLAMAEQQPEGPLLIEVPSQNELNENPTAQMALAAVLMAHSQTTSLTNRPLALIARGEGENPWVSAEEVKTASLNAIQKYSPATAEGVARRMSDNGVSIVLAKDNLITVEVAENFRYNLANILAQTYVGKGYDSALVLGKEVHFNKDGVEVILMDYQDLAERFSNSMKGMILFLTAA